MAEVVVSVAVVGALGWLVWALAGATFDIRRDRLGPRDSSSAYGVRCTMIDGREQGFWVTAKSAEQALRKVRRRRRRKIRTIHEVKTIAEWEVEREVLFGRAP